MSKSKIFLYILLAFLTGVLAASVLILPYEDGNVLKFVSGFAAILGIILISLTRFNLVKDSSIIPAEAGIQKNFLLGFLILFFSFGVFWYQRDIDFNIADRNNLINKIVSDGKAQGIIVDEPEFKADRAKYVLAINDNQSFKILIQAPKYPEYKYGDEILVEGKIEEPKNFTEDFDWRAYLVKDDIYLTVYNPQIKLLAQDKGNKVYAALYKFKNKLEDIFKENLSEPHASFLAGITLGSKSGIPEDVYEKFKATGTAHIVALSGYNISIIAWAVMGALMFFMAARNISFWISLVVIVLFVLMTGVSASVVRAAAMGILILIARQQGRLYTAKNALVFAGAAMVFLDPKILRFDVGFQLSFIATLGLILISPKSEENLKKFPKLFGMKEAFIATISAQIFVLPLLIYQFGYFSPIGILVNVLILPAVPIAMFLGFLGSFTGLIYPVFAKIFLWPAWLFLSYILNIVEIFS